MNAAFLSLLLPSAEHLDPYADGLAADGAGIDLVTTPSTSLVTAL
eukprot:CAMPEP_0202881098 /NCGR_PEP_ID=MMETSP1391-20130828/36039_1 /ASSEMBLY_ACC=CAM_ASM_000867 /TAXON_ID=1034604 /ORGANISM="Chlamydomonas leiostraca, Strain SAG 11-49" /LENGTH=44 /DNA_ID= /DNA_START= /DNA_END= /DNA_ORIENTATION=